MKIETNIKTDLRQDHKKRREYQTLINRARSGKPSDDPAYRKNPDFQRMLKRELAKRDEGKI